MTFEMVQKLRRRPKNNFLRGRGRKKHRYLYEDVMVCLKEYIYKCIFRMIDHKRNRGNFETKVLTNELLKNFKGFVIIINVLTLS